MGKLEGKVAAITGGTRSIGRAMAEAFLAEGALMKLAFQPKTAAQIQAVLDDVLATPPDIAAKYRQIVQP